MILGFLRIPLPPFKIGTDQEFEPLWQTLRFSDSARFERADGATVGSVLLLHRGESVIPELG